MNLKGDYSGEVTYDVGDVVRWENGDIFRMKKQGPAGTAPVNTMYWVKITGDPAMCISFMVDIINNTNEAIINLDSKIPTNVGDESIILKSGENEYLVSVDDTGDTPEVIAELIEGEGGDS